MSVQPNSIMGLDLTTSQGRQALQDVIDQLAGTITKQLTGGSPANPSVIDTLRVKKLYVHEGIDVLPGDKPPAEGLAALVVPFLISRRGRPQVLRYEDQNDGGDLMEWRWQPYALSTPTEDTGDWELAAYSAQRDTAGAFRRLGAIRFGHDGRIRTYTASEILVFDSSALSPLTTKGDLYGHDGSNDVRIPGGTDWKVPVYLASAASGVSPQTIDDLLNQIPGAGSAGYVLTTDGSTRSFEPASSGSGTVTSANYPLDVVSGGTTVEIVDAGEEEVLARFPGGGSGPPDWYGIAGFLGACMGGGSAGDVLTTDGTDASWQPPSGGSSVTYVNWLPVKTKAGSLGTSEGYTVPTGDLAEEGATLIVYAWGASGGAASMTFDGTTVAAIAGGSAFSFAVKLVGDGAGNVTATGAEEGGSNLSVLGSGSAIASVDGAITVTCSGDIYGMLVYRLASESEAAAGNPGGGSGGTDVTALYIPTPTFHYDAQFASGFQTSGSNVTRWDDTAGSLLHAAQGTSTNQPTLGGSGATSHVDFDGTDNYVFFSGTLTGMTSTSGELWAVFELDGLGTDGTIFAVGNSGSSTQYFGLRVNSSNKLEVFENNSGTPDICYGSTTLTTGQVYVVRLRSNATTWTLYLDGTAETLTASSGANNGDWWGDVGTRNRLALGALVRSTVANYFNGKIHEVFGWDSSGKLITDRMATQILAVTRAYWGLS